MASDSQGPESEVADVLPAEPKPRPRVRRRGRRRRKIKWGILVTTVLVTGAVLLVAQTGRGQEAVLRAAIDRVKGSLAGELQVDGIRSGTLLRGATLTGVRLDAEGERSFMTADSVQLRYSLTSTLLGGGTIRSAVFWGLDVEISRRSSDEPINVARLLRPGAPDTTGAADRPLPLGRIGVRDGRVRILTPGTAGPRSPTVVLDDGTTLKELLFDSLDADLEEALLVPSSAVQFEARVASFSSRISIVDEPLVVQEAFGDVTFGAQGIRLLNGAYRLPRSLLSGSLLVGPRRPGESWSVRSNLRMDDWADLADVQWIDPRIPDGRARGGLNVTVQNGIVVDLDDLEVELEASHVIADGRMTFADELSFRAMAVTANPIVMDRIEPWVGVDFPFEGWLSGEATFDGTLEDLTSSGRVTLVPTGLGGRATTADFSGTLHRGASPGMTGFQAHLEPLNYQVLESIWPGLHPSGTGSADLEMDGRLADGMSVIADLSHEYDVGDASRVTAAGTVSLADGRWATDLRGEVLPLSLTILSAMQPDLGLQGSVTGEVELRGPLDSLSVVSDLRVGEGTLSVQALLDAFDPASGYMVEAGARNLPLATLLARFPDRSAWSGEFALRGDGFAPDSMSATGRLNVTQGRVGPLRVASGDAVVRVERGVVTADSLQAVVGGITVYGDGTLGLADGRFGTSRFDFAGESLVGLRPLVMGVADSVMVQDELTDLARDFLRLGGIDPDTLPFEADVRMAGGISGSAIVSGALGDLDVDVTARVVDGRYQQDAVDTITVELKGTGLPGVDGTWDLGASASGILWRGLEFAHGEVSLNLFERSGAGSIDFARGPDEVYAARGSIRIDSVGGALGLTTATARINEQVWELVHPSDMSWDGSNLVVDSLSIVRGGRDPMQMRVDGTITRGAASDFHVLVEGLHIEQVARFAQIDDLEMGGHVDLNLAVHGSAEAPEIEGSFRLDGPRYGAMQLTRVEGSIDYAERVATFELDGWDGVRATLHAAGDMPMDLALVPVEDRIPDARMDVSLSADSLDAAIALSYLTTLEQVVGVVSGDVHVGGTTEQPEPDGLLTLQNGEWSIEAIGVRHTGVNGGLRLRPDRTVEVDLSTSGVGRSDVTGVVLLSPLRDPVLDLTFNFDGFPAVVRPDIEGLISGEFVLNGSYRRPLAQGDLTVDEGTIYVDEIRRAAEVVDLRDPFLFRTGIGVDTTALISQPLIAGLRNPFFDNLRVNVNLSVPGDTWLRSIETNVEIGGDLLVRYDRSAGDFVLIGELQALRGSHLVLGRNFEIDGGAVGFIGRPGMNPSLDIQASSRIRRLDEPPIDIEATVEGTLLTPLVTLSSEEAGLGQADLVSYLVFGQPTSARGRGDALGDFGAGASDAAVGLGVSYIGGRVVNQVGAAMGRRLGFDYVSVETGAGRNLENDFLFGTQIELGRYLGDDVFFVMVVRPSRGDTEQQNRIAGARVEWAFTDDYNVEAFLEDRFLRSGSGFGTVPLRGDERILGVFFFREWGY